MTDNERAAICRAIAEIDGIILKMSTFHLIESGGMLASLARTKAWLEGALG
jgi:hypothetical protein